MAHTRGRQRPVANYAVANSFDRRLDRDVSNGDIPDVTALSCDFRTEVFNLTNTPPLGAPNVVAGGAGFGSITAAGDSRVMQFALKFNF